MVTIPKYNAFHWPTVVALRHLGSSGTIEEINDTVIINSGSVMSSKLRCTRMVLVQKSLTGLPGQGRI